MTALSVKIYTAIYCGIYLRESTFLKSMTKVKFFDIWFAKLYLPSIVKLINSWKYPDMKLLMFMHRNVVDKNHMKVVLNKAIICNFEVSLEVSVA